MVVDTDLLWSNQDPSVGCVHEDQPHGVSVDRQSIVEHLQLGSGEPRYDTGQRGRVVVADALTALNRFESLSLNGLNQQINLVYIDPPYNTGRLFADFDDARSHSEWLSMLESRVRALIPHLAVSASVWIHLDDSEQHRARCLLDDIFGEDAFVTTVVWQKRTTRESRSAFSSSHDYIHVYSPTGPKNWKRYRNLLPKSQIGLRNRDGDSRGPWTDAPFTAPGYRANQQYTIVNPAGIRLRPPIGRSWYAIESTYRRLLAEERIWFPKGGAGAPRLKIFGSELRGLVPNSLWSAEEVGTNDDAKRHLMSLFPEMIPFETPKPEGLLRRIIHIASNPDDLVVDFFAGSGTTAAVAHKMGRKWIAIELSDETVRNYLVPRMVQVMRGEDSGGITDDMGWRGGGSFDVMELGTSHSNRLRLPQLQAASIASS